MLYRYICEYLINILPNQIDLKSHLSNTWIYFTKESVTKLKDIQKKNYFSETANTNTFIHFYLSFKCESCLKFVYLFIFLM